MELTSRSPLLSHPLLPFVRHASSEEQDRAAAIASERLAIAREIHDGIVQELIAMVFLARTKPGARGPTHENIQPHIEALASRSLDMARKLMHELRGIDQPQEVGRKVCLNSELQQALHDALTNRGLAFIFSCPMDIVVAAHIGREVAKIVREAAINAVKHSKAESVMCFVTSTVGHTVIRLIDEGIGFNPLAPSTGFGIQGMQERASAFGGKLSILSMVGRGCQISLSICNQHDPLHTVPLSKVEIMPSEALIRGVL